MSRFSRSYDDSQYALPPPKDSHFWRTLKRLSPYLLQYKWRIFLALSCLVAAKFANVGVPLVFKGIIDALDGKVKEVKVSTRLKDHPVCLSADGPLSIEMEKVLSKQPGSEGVKSDKVLELNINHPVFAVLKAAQEAGDTDKLKKYSALLYAQAQLIEGLPVDDPAAYAEAVCSLMK